VPDHDVLKYAVSTARVVLTFNRLDFMRLHRSIPVHSGIVVCTYDADAVALAARIHRQLTAHSTLDGILLRVNRPAK
jgi:predicted dinucleotide-binding enzyme